MSRLRSEQRREQLIGVAARLFARGGHDATTTAAIASAAGVTEPILYRHFANKNELFIAAVREQSRQTLSHWRGIIEASAEPAEQLRRLVLDFPQHVRRHSDAYQILHRALATTRDKRVLGVLREHREQMEGMLHGIIARGQEQHAFRSDVDPRLLGRLVIDLSVGRSLTLLHLQQDATPQCQQFLELLLRELLGSGGRS